MFSGRVVPVASATRTHVFAGDETLLVEHPAAVGYEREVLGVAAMTVYVMVKAIPEQGEIPPHSLDPDASIVVTSTTPGPLAVPTVHEPV